MFLLQTEEVSDEFMLCCALSNLVFLKSDWSETKELTMEKAIEINLLQKKDTNFRLWLKFQGPQESIGYKTKINHLEMFVGSLVLCQHKPFGQGLTSWNLSKCNDSKLHKLDSCVRYTDIRDLWFGTSHWRSFQVWYSKVGIIMLRVEPLEMSLWLQVWMKICKSCKWEVDKKFQEQSTRFPDWKCENVVDI